MMDDTQERRIALALQAGRPDGWREFYDAFSERVWRNVARLLGHSSADVADVVQETFIAAARSARSYDENRGTIWCWLWGIARRHLALHFRKQNQQERLRRAAEVLANGSAAADPQEARELAEFVRAILAEIPAEYADALTTRYMDDVSVEQMARDERSTETAIRSRLARARSSFRARYEQHVGAAATKPAGGSP